MKRLVSIVARIAIVSGLMLCVAHITDHHPVQAQASGVTIYAVTIGNTLVSFDSATPGVLRSVALISGLQPGETVDAIDFRPRNSRLYALGSTNRLYTINTQSGAATLVGTGPVGPALNGTAIGFDFNPVADRIRVVTDADENLRLNPDNGTVVAVDGSLSYAAGDLWDQVNPNVVAAAYTDNFPGATATTLYGIDIDGVRLVRQGSANGSPVSPNEGQLTTIGKLGVTTTGMAGFDIATNGAAFASLTSPDNTLSQLYSINLTTGAATRIGNIGSSEAIRDIAVVIATFNAASVSSASFQGGEIASESMVSAFGFNLATRILTADSVPLPNSLAGTTVRVLDSARVERLAPLFGVSPGQVTYQMPTGVAPGTAIITITSANGTMSAGLIQIVRVAPGLFAANANGRDAASGLVLRVRADGSQRYESISQFNLTLGRVVPLPIDLGPATDRVYLVLFGTGFRFFSMLSSASVTIGGMNLPALFVGPQPTLVAVDQVNVLLPRSLGGLGEMNVVLNVDGKSSNTVTISVR